MRHDVRPKIRQLLRVDVGPITIECSLATKDEIQTMMVKSTRNGIGMLHESSVRGILDKPNVKTLEVNKWHLEVRNAHIFIAALRPAK